MWFEFEIYCSPVAPGCVYVNRRRTYSDAKNARNEKRNEMNAKTDFALGGAKVASS
ncbi:hypothetical protein JZ751_027097 [Albula glossodonta]|uniref:Uncharacterized protein n=1 Tax=Albula glossodonta TaxID=121402 RepID=A0A8T2NEB8_9TELE|nr:hypothetical protein JZ751_027097 [Albula glossodonta]